MRHKPANVLSGRVHGNRLPALVQPIKEEYSLCARVSAAEGGPVALIQKFLSTAFAYVGGLGLGTSELRGGGGGRARFRV